MKLLLSIAIAAFTFAPASAQWVYYYVPVDCGPGGCYPGQSCQPRFYMPPQYSNPRRPAPSNPEPDGIETPPVGADGTPDFKPLPPPPAVQTPPLPPADHVELPQRPPTSPNVPQPAPTVDPKAAAEQEKFFREIRDSQTTIEKSLLVIKEGSSCKCDNSKLEAAIVALTQENHSLVLAITDLKNKQPAPAPVASGAPVSYDIRPHKD